MDRNDCVSFEASQKTSVLWNAAQCSLIQIYRRFRGDENLRAIKWIKVKE
jgi:hypothetical protein